VSAHIAPIIYKILGENMGQNIINFKNDEKIIKAGQTEQRMYIILEGKVNVHLSSEKEDIQVATMGKGDFFGEISLFTEQPRSATIQAIGDVKVVYFDNITELKSFLVSNPQFAAKMVQTLTQRLAKTNEMLIGKTSEMNRFKQTETI
jgi:CRP-like cAMP-binding protein